jgi:hypothetical protein
MLTSCWINVDSTLTWCWLSGSRAKRAHRTWLRLSAFRVSRFLWRSSLFVVPQHHTNTTQSLQSVQVLVALLPVCRPLTSHKHRSERAQEGFLVGDRLCINARHSNTRIRWLSIECLSVWSKQTTQHTGKWRRVWPSWWENTTTVVDMNTVKSFTERSLSMWGLCLGVLPNQIDELL